MENNRISDSSGKANFDYPLNCTLKGNEFEGVTLNFVGAENILLKDNEWIMNDKKQLSIVAKKGSVIDLGKGNSCNGSMADFKKWVTTDESSAVESDK